MGNKLDTSGVPETCPLIDKMINELKTISKMASKLADKINQDILSSEIYDISNSAEDLINDLERIRSANRALREHGEQLQEKINILKDTLRR